MRIKITKVVETEKFKELGIEKSEEMKIEMKKKDNVDQNSICSGAAEPKKGPEVEMLKFGSKKHWFSQDILFHDLEDEYDLDIVSVLAENVSPSPGSSAVQHL